MEGPLYKVCKKKAKILNKCGSEGTTKNLYKNWLMSYICQI